MGRAAKAMLPFRSAHAVGRPAMALCGFLMALAFLSNVVSLARLALPALRGFDSITAIFQVRQSWEVFAPQPVHYRRDYRLVAHMADGSTVNLMDLLPTPLLRYDANSRAVFASPRWNKYFTRLDQLTDDDWRSLGRYLCRQASTASSVREVEITLITMPIEDSPAAVRPVEHRSFECVPVSVSENFVVSNKSLVLNLYHTLLGQPSSTALLQNRCREYF